MMPKFQHHHTTRVTAAVVALFTSVSLVFGQTKIVAPDNKYSVQDDVKAGREAAGQVEEQLPILRDDGVDDYVERVGQRLVEGIPSEFRHSEFRYTFDVVNVSDINAFALPGGPMFVNRGMLEAAKNEGEVAGVLAHEISHVALRHGTAQAGKATPYAVGSILGQIAGAILGGNARPGRLARIAVRLRHGVPEVWPRIRAAGRSSRRADHGARRIRPARHGEHVPDDSGQGRQRRSRVDEQPPEPEQPLSGDQPGSGTAARGKSDSQHAGVHPGEVAAAADGALRRHQSR